ncbi:hypothetical protein ACFS4T_29755 [Pseudomonas lini]
MIRSTRSGNGLASGSTGVGSLAGIFEQAEQVEFAVLAEEDFGLGFVQFDIGQVQRLGPEAVDLQVGV